MSISIKKIKKKEKNTLRPQFRAVPKNTLKRQTIKFYKVNYMNCRNVKF